MMRQQLHGKSGRPTKPHEITRRRLKQFRVASCDLVDRLALVIACASLLAISSACARQANQAPPQGAATKELVARVGQPVRVSAENGDAAEPAVATSRDGKAYL